MGTETSKNTGNETRGLAGINAPAEGMPTMGSKVVAPADQTITGASYPSGAGLPGDPADGDSSDVPGGSDEDVIQPTYK